MNLLLLSNSTNHGSQYLEHATDAVASFLAGVDELLFIPYAGSDYSSYTELVAKRALRWAVRSWSFVETRA
jgi:dipeptidase E